MEASQNSDIFEQARGVIAARLDVDPDTAAHILERVSQRERISRDELAADVLASCTDSRVALPRDLYTNGYGFESAG